MSGVRGLAGSELGADTAMRYCASFASATGDAPCALARDTRPSGAALYDAAAAAILASGADVAGLGVAPTPVAFYEARRAGRGVVVTASHNPLEWNGLKFAVGGRGANAGEMSEIAAGANARGGGGGGKKAGGKGGAAEAAQPPPAFGALREAESDYAEAAVEAISRTSGGGGPRGAAVVDAGGGAAAGVAPEILRRIGCDVQVVNAAPGESDRGPDPTAGSLPALEAACSSGNRAGFAFDLDGDRVVVVVPGEEGGGRPRALSPDATLCLGVAAALEAGCRRFVLSIDTTGAAESLVLDAGGRVWRSRVGEANVVAEMDARGAEAGGEGSSAGFILRSFNGCRDGMLAAGLIAAAAGAGGGRAVAGAASRIMSGHAQARAKVPADSALHARILELADARIGGRFSESVAIDGVKWIGEGSWVMARGSNTEDAVRVSAEARDADKARALLREASEAVAASYEVARRGGDR